MPGPKIAKYQENEPHKLKLVKAYATYFYLFNTTKPPFDNPLVRNALSLAVNRKAIVENITKAGEAPASTLSILNESYNPTFDRENYNPELARQLLSEAGFPKGEGFPAFTLVYNTADNHRKIALAIQQMWKTELGISTTLENQEWKIFLNTRQNLHFDVARAGSVSSLADPQDFLGSLITGHGMNDTGWSNAEYDTLIAQAKTKTNQSERFEILAKAEAILLNELPLMPLYYYSYAYLIDPSVKGVKFNAVDRINYKDIHINHNENK